MPKLTWGGNPTVAIGGFVLIGVFLLLVLVSRFSPPAHADKLISLSVASLSLGVALIAFGFLRGQTANIQYRAVGVAVNIGGALVAGVFLFLSLQFGIRGTSNLLIELYTDSQFRQPWRAPQGTAAPEFAASLASYTVVAKPDDFIVRFHNLPIFERVSFYSRDAGWNITQLESSERFA